MLGEHRLEYEYSVGKKLAAQGQHVEALELFIKILKERYEDAWSYDCAKSLAIVKPGTADEEELSLLGAKRSEYDYQVGKIFYEQKRYEEALPYFRHAYKSRPEIKVWEDRYIECLLSIDYTQTTEEDFMLLGERRLEYEFNVGKKLASQGQHAEALEHFIKILKEKYEDAWAYHCAQSLVAVKPGAASEEELSILGDALPEYYYLLGKFFEEQAQIEDACKNYADALRICPDFKECQKSFLTCLMKKKESDITEDELYLLGDKISEGWHGIAAQRIKKNKEYQAIPALERALAYDSHKSKWWQELGECYEALGKFEKAEFAFEKSKELNDVSIMDIAPTIAKILGLDPEPEWEGRSLINR